MVLFKRKPVRYRENPEIENEDQELWVIDDTGEYFTDYEQYLTRMDFYKQRRFICRITGHSGLTFFEALKSELAGAQEVEQAFPEALKGPVLRRVQFQTISRIDTLVDLIFDEFRSDYYPGEAVTVHVITGERLNGVVRDKTSFGEKVLPDGTVSPPFNRYFVSLDNRPTEEAVVDDAHISRDRKIFTKQVLRSFIKKTVTREAWTGAPWLVKHDVAAVYHIDTRVPPHLRYETKAAERKQNLQQKKAAAQESEGLGGQLPPGFGQVQGQGQLPELKPAGKSHKSKQLQGAKSKQQSFLTPISSIQQYMQGTSFSHTFQANGHHAAGPHLSNFHNTTFQFAQLASVPHIQAPPPPQPIKYPIEDLQVPPRPNGPKRPALKYFSQDTPMLTTNEGNGVLMKSVGPLLESWDTLNVYAEVLKLDSFTFDDFVEAMQFTSEDVACELFVEIHCAALKLLVDSEANGGKVYPRLPEIEKEEEEEESLEEVAEPTPEPEPEPKKATRATRSSLAKLEAEALKQEEAREPTPEPSHKHRAVEMQSDIHWIDRLRKRDFKNGGWEEIIVGLLHQLSKSPRLQKTCEEILEQLAPINMEPTMQTARLQYARLDINLRIQALQIVCVLCAETKGVRGHMEECSETMTGYRKEKIEYQRNRKALLEELRLLNEERKKQLPANMPQTPEPDASKDIDTKMAELDEEIQEPVEDEVNDTDEEPHQGRSLRRGIDRAAQRKRKRDADQEKKEMAEAKVPKQSKQWLKLLKDIAKKESDIKGCEERIAELDNDLREADCPRTRVLGKDRFWNRYYWFERNGMPYGGLPNSSTADAGYANGCIWVQGPDDLEREGYIEMKKEWQDEYYAKFNMTVPERKVMEEGSTHVFNAHQWGYFDEPEALDQFIAYLDTRGFNEMRLKKELNLYRDKIVSHMKARKEYLNPTEEKEVVEVKPRTRKQREQSHIEQTVYRCLAWHNEMALADLGHLHSDEPRVRKSAKKAAAAAASQIVVEEPAPMKTRSGKKEKEKGRGGPSRQGSRYNF